jgi:predicted anti-sigma-YlaC factor YlaD
VPVVEMARHLAECAACRCWQVKAIEVTEMARVRAVTMPRDLTARILGREPVAVNTRDWWARASLGVVALSQLAIGVAQVMGVSALGQHAGHTGAASHLFDDATTWNLAVGIGLSWVVFHTSAAAGQIPMVGGFVLVLLGLSTHDLIVGTAPVSRIAGHSLLVAGLALLVVVHRQRRRATPGRETRSPTRTPPKRSRTNRTTPDTAALARLSTTHRYGLSAIIAGPDVRGADQPVEQFRRALSALRTKVARSSRARARRERIVPTGHRHTLAASS